MNVFAQAIRDESGQVDVAFVAVFWVMISVLGAITVVCFLAAAIVVSCLFRQGMTCTYDPQPLGIAVGAICGGFAAALGALGAYMRLVQPPKAQASPSVQVTNADSVSAAPNLPQKG